MAPAHNGGSEVEQRQRSQLARWNPFALLDEFQEELARLWSRPFGVPMTRPYRRVPLPFDVKPDHIQATLNDGVLEVQIPKPAEATLNGKRIPVK